MNGRSPAAVTLALLCVLAACGAEPQSGAAKKAESTPKAEASQTTSIDTTAVSPSPTPLLAVAPAAEAGGLCRKLNYARVARTIGVDFNVAAASGESGATQVCVLQRAGFTAPDLVLSKIPVEEPPATDGQETEGSEPNTAEEPDADAEVEAFRADYQPDGATKVTGLGKAAYSQILAGEDGGGAQVEVGWLGAQAVYVLVYTTAPATTVAAAGKDTPRVVSLAKQFG